MDRSHGTLDPSGIRSPVRKTRRMLKIIEIFLAWYHIFSYLCTVIQQTGNTMKTAEAKWENDSPIQINISINVENGKINGAREFANLLCSKRLYVKGYRIRFTQKRNDKKTVLVEANYRPIGTINIMKGFVFESSVDRSKGIMYGSPDREFPDNEQVLSVMLHDAFGMNHEIARVENGMLNTSDIELAQRIVNIYSDFVERMIVPVYSEGPTFDEIVSIVMSLGKFKGRLIVDDPTKIEVSVGGKPIVVMGITYGGVCDSYGVVHSFCELDDKSIESIKRYIER